MRLPKLMHLRKLFSNTVHTDTAYSSRRYGDANYRRPTVLNVRVIRGRTMSQTE